MSTPMTPAQAAQNRNRTGGGQYKEKTHSEARLSLTSPYSSAVTSAMIHEQLGRRPQDFLNEAEMREMAEAVIPILSDEGDYGPDAVDRALSIASREQLGRDVVVDRDLAFAAEGMELEPDQVRRIQDELATLRRRDASVTPSAEPDPNAVGHEHLLSAMKARDFVRVIGSDDEQHTQWHTARRLCDALSKAASSDAAQGGQRQTTQAVEQIESEASQLTGEGRLEEARLFLRASNEARQAMNRDRHDSGEDIKAPVNPEIYTLVQDMRKGVLSAEGASRSGRDRTWAMANQLEDRMTNDALTGTQNAVSDYAKALRTRAPIEHVQGDRLVASQMESVARAIDSRIVGDGSPSSPVSAQDPRVQAGEVFDTVQVDGRAFHRRRDDAYPNTPYAVRIQTKEPMSPEQVQQVAGLVGYAMSKTGPGEPSGDPVQDTPYSVIVPHDTTKGQRYNHLHDRFEPALEEYMHQGHSPKRKTKGGTSAIEMDKPLPEFELYYDDAILDGPGAQQ